MSGLAHRTIVAGAQNRPDEKAFFALYKEMVETNTTVTTGSCTDLAAKIGARFKAAGFADSQLTYFSTPEHPRDGGIVVVYPGRSRTAKPMLLKIAPDLSETELDAMAAVLHEARIDGVICTNTTIDHSAVTGHRHAGEAGGLSGKPLFAKSTAVLRGMHERVRLLGGRVSTGPAPAGGFQVRAVLPLGGRGA